MKTRVTAWQETGFYVSLFSGLVMLGYLLFLKKDFRFLEYYNRFFIVVPVLSFISVLPLRFILKDPAWNSFMKKFLILQVILLLVFAVLLGFVYNSTGNSSGLKIFTILVRAFITWSYLGLAIKILGRKGLDLNNYKILRIMAYFGLGLFLLNGILSPETKREIISVASIKNALLSVPFLILSYYYLKYPGKETPAPENIHDREEETA